MVGTLSTDLRSAPEGAPLRPEEDILEVQLDIVYDVGHCEACSLLI
jgi:hypothetical protein